MLLCEVHLTQTFKFYKVVTKAFIFIWVFYSEQMIDPLLNEEYTNFRL